jgi:hypothetical protein
MAAVDEDVTQTAGHRASILMLACPLCGEDVPFPFLVNLTMTATDVSMLIEAEIVGGRINEQPLFDHQLERHVPDAEGFDLPE